MNESHFRSGSTVEGMDVYLGTGLGLMLLGLIFNIVAVRRGSGRAEDVPRFRSLMLVSAFLYFSGSAACLISALR